MSGQSLLRAFASPYDSDSAAYSALVASRCFQQVQQRTLLGLRADAQPAALREALAAATPQHDCWRPELGIAARCADGGDAVAAALQLLILAEPKPLSLVVQRERSMRLLVEGLPLVVSGPLRFDLDSEALSIVTAAATYRFRYDALNGWLSDNSGLPAPARLARPGGPRYLIGADAGTGGGFPTPWATAAGAAEAACARSAEVVVAALDLLALATPYAGWLDGALRGAITGRADGTGELCSPDYPGLVAVAAEQDPLQCAERLVGAACQQKFHQLALVHAITGAGREEIRYVAERRSYTTTRRALAAAHEHVNVALMLNALARRRPGDAQVATRLARRLLLLATDCVPSLQRNRALTAHGAGLWRILHGLTQEHLAAALAGSARGAAENTTPALA